MRMSAFMRDARERSRVRDDQKGFKQTDSVMEAENRRSFEAQCVLSIDACF